MTATARSAAYLCLFCTGAMLATTAAPQEVDPEGAELRTRVGVVYDDNIFRLPSGIDAELNGESGRSDSLLQAEVGGRMVADVSLQQFVLDGTVTRNQYLKFDELSFTGYEGQALWNWQLALRLRGVAGVELLRRQTSFAEFRAPGQNIITVFQPFFEIRPALRQSLFAYAGYRYIDSSNSSEVLESDNYESDVFTAGLGYSLWNEGEVRLGFRRTSTDFTSEQLVDIDGVLQPLRNDFTQKEIEARLIYPLGGRTELNGRIAYTERDHKEQSERNFSGVTGNLTIGYELTPLVKITATARRQLSGVDDILSNFVTTNAIAGRIEYSPREAVMIRLDADAAKRKYNGFAIVAPTEGREDEVWSAGAAIEYMWPLGSRAQLSFRHEARDSTLPDLNYKANIAVASLLFVF